MGLLINHVTIDCRDPYSLGSFWAEALDSSLQDDDEPGDPAAMVYAATVAGGEVGVLFEQVPDEKVVKNPVHLDVWPSDRTRDEMVDHLVRLGASVVADRRREDGTGWVVMSDPEGNEFCVERGAAERKPDADAET